MNENSYLINALNNLDEIRQNRRHFHKYPELGFHEFQTAEKITGFLRELDLEVQTGIAGTGVVGLLRCKEQDKTAA